MISNILIRTPNHLGDCIMALPMINEAREAYPGSSITVLTPDWLADLYSSNLGVDHVIPIPKEIVHGLIAVMKIKDLISNGNYDLGYILPPSFGAAASFKLAGVNERIGYISDGRRLLLSKPLALPEPLNSEHRSQLYFNLLLRGSGAKLEYVSPKLFLNDNDIAAGQEMLGKAGIGSDEKYAVVAFSSVAESRRWGIDNYTQLIKEIVNRWDCKVALVGGADEARLGDEIVVAASGGKVVNLAGKCSLRESAAVSSNAFFFVGNDSGGAHLAAAVGTPLIILSGADDPDETSPVSSKKHVLIRKELECISCVKNKCPLKDDQQMQCMKKITLPMVLNEIESLIS